MYCTNCNERRSTPQRRIAHGRILKLGRELGFLRELQIVMFGLRHRLPSLLVGQKAAARPGRLTGMGASGQNS